MAPSNSHLGKRVKGVQIKRPFKYGTTARPFNDTDNQKPPGIPDSHTHSWEVFVGGIDDTDVSYWLSRVQFKLHESIPNHLRTVHASAGVPLMVKETGWGEFEVAIKLYFVAESGEKPQTLYHYLRFHPYGRTEAEKEAMSAPGAEVRAWSYDEVIFNEPYDHFHYLLTSGARPKGWSVPLPPPTPSTPGTARSASAKAGKGKGKGKGSASAAAAPPPSLPDADAPPPAEAWERTAIIPATNRPGQPFSRETEAVELRQLADARSRTQDLIDTVMARIAEQEKELADLKADDGAAADSTLASTAGKRPIKAG